MCEHDREIDWQPKQPRQRVPRFRIYCTKCGTTSEEFRLPGYSIDGDGYPSELAQASDDILDHADEILP